MTVSVYTFAIGLLFTLPFGFQELTHSKWDLIQADLCNHTYIWQTIWFKIAFIIIGASFFTYLLNAWALKHGSSSLVGSYIYLQPVLAAIIAQIAGKDQLTTHKVLLMILILVGVYLATKKNKELA